jgi:hypothetical protein
VSSAGCSSRPCLSRRALRRTAGAVALMLLAHRTVAPLFIACGATGSAQPQDNGATMVHEHHGPSSSTPTNAPAPAHGSNCDHSMPGNGCCMAAGCVTAVMGASLLAVAPRPVQQREIPASIERFLSPVSAPDVPPPRA